MWVLVLLMFNGIYSAHALEIKDFKSENACEAAAAKIKTSLGATRSVYFVTSCVYK